MSYIDLSFYINFGGVPIDGDAFSYLAERASDVIDQITKDRIQDVGFDNLHERIQTKVQKATAAQVEFLYMNGGAESIHGSNNIASISVGSFSYSNSSTEGSSQKTVSPAVVEYLKGTGLLYSGVNVCG